MVQTEAQKAAVRRYQQKRDQMTIRPDAETGAEIRRIAQQAGMSIQQLCIAAIAEYAERHGIN